MLTDVPALAEQPGELWHSQLLSLALTLSPSIMEARAAVARARTLCIWSSALLTPRATLHLPHAEYFFGSGLFYAAFRGNASANMFRSAGYSGFTLRYRDLIAFIDSADPSGMNGLAAYLDQLLPLRPVVTNLDVVGSQLHGRVRSHVVIRLNGSRALALLGVVGGSDLSAVNPILHARLTNHLQALKAEVALLQAMPSAPELVVVVLPAHQLAREAERLDPAMQVNATAIVRQVAREVAGVHVLIVPNLLGTPIKSGSTLSNAPAHYWETGADGNRVLVVLQHNLDHDVTNVSVLFDDNNRLVGGATALLSSSATLQPGTSAIGLDCSAAEDAPTRYRLLDYHYQMSTRFSTTEGYLMHDLEAEDDGWRPGTCQGLRSGAEGVLARCGCRVAQCGIGDLITDALRWKARADVALINGGAIRNGLLKGKVSRQHLIESLPFGGEVTVVRVSGAALVAALNKSVVALWKTHGPASSEQVTPHGRFLQVSGLSFTWGFTGSGSPTISHVIVDGAPLAAFSSVVVATNAFLAKGGDGYSMLAVADKNGLGVSITAAVGDYLREHAPTPPGLDIASNSNGRITSTFMQVRPANDDGRGNTDTTTAGIVGAVIGGVAVPLCALFILLVRRAFKASAVLHDRMRSELQVLSQAEKDGFEATRDGSVHADAHPDGCTFWLLDAQDLRNLDVDGLPTSGADNLQERSTQVGSSPTMMQNICRERRLPGSDTILRSPLRRNAGRTFDASTVMTTRPTLRLVPLTIRNEVSQARLLANSVLAVSQ